MTAAQALTLFDPEDLLEWVVEVDEVFLNSTSAQPRGPMNWWAEMSGRPGLMRRTVYLTIVPPGALLYLACDDADEAEWLRDVLVDHGMHDKGVTVRHLGRTITCRGCGQSRPFWVRTRRSGQLCRHCWTSDSYMEVA